MWLLDEDSLLLQLCQDCQDKNGRKKALCLWDVLICVLSWMIDMFIVLIGDRCVILVYITRSQLRELALSLRLLEVCGWLPTWSRKTFSCLWVYLYRNPPPPPPEWPINSCWPMSGGSYTNLIFYLAAVDRK